MRAMTYLALKFAHIFIAITALGSSAALAIVLGFYTDDPAHGVYALRLVRNLLWSIVVPGYVLMLATGMWMGHIENLLDAHWAEMAMNIWGLGALFIGLTVRSVHRQIQAPSRREAVLARGYATGWGLVVVTILYYMVFKPG